MVMTTTNNRLSYTVTLAYDNSLPALLTFDSGILNFTDTPTNSEQLTILYVQSGSNGNVSSWNHVFHTIARKIFTHLRRHSIMAYREGSPGRYKLYGTDDHDRMFGRGGNDTLYGYAGNDFMDGEGGNDELRVGSGKDTLKGGNGNDWLNGGRNNDNIDWTPTNDNVGSLSIRVIAIESIEDVFNLTVNNVNDAPTLTNPLLDQNVNEDEPFSLTIPNDTLQDVDPGDILTYTATLADGNPLPAWLSFDSNSLTFTGTPTNDDVDSFDIKVVATDTSGESIEDVFYLTVNNGGNDIPTLTNPLLDQSTNEDETFSFTIPNNIFQEIDQGDSLTYTATLADGNPLPAWLSFDSNSLTFTGTPTNDDVDSFDIKVVATDTSGESIEDVFYLTNRDIITGDNLNLGEVDTITLNHTIQTITLDQTYKNPVIFAPSVSLNGGQLVTPHITNVTDNSFDIYLQEPSNLDGTHTLETLSYLVFEAGTYQLSDGTLVEVGMFDTDATTVPNNRTLTPWQTVEFDIDFEETPVIFSQIQTNNDSNLVRTRQQNASLDRFEVAMEEDEILSRNGENHADETIGYIAIAEGTGNSNGVTFLAGSTDNSVTPKFSSISFGGKFNNISHFLAHIGTYDGLDPAGIRFRNFTDNKVQVALQEDTTYDEETNHTTEVVNYLALQGDNFLQGTASDPLMGNKVVIRTEKSEYILGFAENDTRTGKGSSDVFVLRTRSRYRYYY